LTFEKKMINIYNIIKIKKTLIKSGGGTGPMKPGNQYIFIYMVLNPAVYLLKDKYKFVIKT